MTFQLKTEKIFGKSSGGKSCLQSKQPVGENVCKAYLTINVLTWWRNEYNDEAERIRWGIHRVGIRTSSEAVPLCAISVLRR